MISIRHNRFITSGMLTRAWLTLAIAWAPFSLVAHGIDEHLDAHPDEVCELCLIASNIESATPASLPAVYPAPLHAAYLKIQTNSGPAHTFERPFARAPPSLQF